MDRFYSKAAQFLRQEDAKQSRKQDDAKPGSEGIQSNVAVKQSGDNSGKVQLNIQNKQTQPRGGNGQNKKRDPNPGPRRRAPMFESYTPLNTSLENVYLQTCNTEQYKKPAPKRSSERQIQTGKFCRFHESYGHTTNDCRHLQDLIEKLIRERKLDQFVRAPQSGGAGPSNPNRAQDQERQEEPARAGGRLVINTISGGPHPADRSWREMESYASSIRHASFECCSNCEDGTPAKQQKTMSDDIIFRSRDADKIEAPTIDPLVISAQVGPAWMKRILVDSGSSVNILFKRAYDLMKMEAKDLKPCQSRVHGFNGSATIPTGIVELPVELGIGERRRVRLLQFVVLDIASPYNAFLGRPALAEFRAAIAPWCLTLKFPTDHGIGIVQGDQAAGRACYVAELREAQKKEKGKGVEESLCVRFSDN